MEMYELKLSLRKELCCVLGVTNGSSKLQWRLKARDDSLVFLETEYKLISDEQNQDIIVARNEVLRFVSYVNKKEEEGCTFIG